MKEDFHEIEAWKWGDARFTFLDLILEMEAKIEEDLDISLEFSSEGMKGTIMVESAATYEKVFPELPLDLVRYLGATVICSDPEHPMEFLFKPKKEGNYFPFPVEFLVLTVYKD